MIAVGQIKPPLELTIHEIVFPFSIADNDSARLEPQAEPDPQPKELCAEADDSPWFPNQIW